MLDSERYTCASGTRTRESLIDYGDRKVGRKEEVASDG